MAFYLKRIVVECSEQGLLSDVGETISGEMERSGETDGDWLACRDFLESWKNKLKQNGLEVIASNKNVRFRSKTKDKDHDNSLKEIKVNNWEWAALRANDNSQNVPTLYITDSSRKAQEHLQQGEPVMALLTAENQGEDFKGVKYLSMHLTDISADYLDKVYRRYAGIPWDILETERCFLRETTESDVDAFYEIYADPSITAYMENLYPDREQELAYTRDYIKNVYELYGHGVWTVCLKENGQVIGRAGLSFREGFEDAELGFVIGITWQGRGIATEVCRAVLEFGARELGFERVIAFVEPDNHISRHLLKKLGFEEREEVELGGKTHVLYRKS